MSDDSVKHSGGVLRKGGHARKGTSGEHPIMQAVRKKLDSIREGTLPELEALNARIDKLKKKSDPPAVVLSENTPLPEGEARSLPEGEARSLPEGEAREGEEDTQPQIRVESEP